MKVSMTISHSSDLNKWNGKCVKIPCIENATKNNQRKKITLKANVYSRKRSIPIRLKQYYNTKDPQYL